MNNRMRFGISALVNVIVALTAYMLPFTLLLYYFAPGFWLGDALSESQVNSLGGHLFPVFASILFWTFLIFVIWWLMTRIRRRR
jgi:uncharacterized membrane protein AbrB (regulator of aidB expression)